MLGAKRRVSSDGEGVEMARQEEQLLHRDEDEARDVAAVLAPRFAPLLPAPFVVDSLCLFGQAKDGMFRILHRYALSG